MGEGRERRKGGWIKAEQLPTPLECERVVTSLSISIFSHHCPGALPASASVCEIVREWARVCTHSSRGESQTQPDGAFLSAR